MKPLIVGEANPYSDDPRDALTPWPAMSAGARLCRMLGRGQAWYLKTFDRANLVTGGPWSSLEATVEAGVLLRQNRPHYILLGYKVTRAFESVMPTLAIVNWQTIGEFTRIPHPSGMCREWNLPGAVDRLRDVVDSILEGVGSEV